VPCQDLTGADRTWAERYEVGDVLRYSRTSKETGIGKGAYAQVNGIDAPNNPLTVELHDGTQRTYDPRRQRGVSVFREETRSFQATASKFTAPGNEVKVANRELGIIEIIDGHERLRMKMDGGRAVELDPRKSIETISSVPNASARFFLAFSSSVGFNDSEWCMRSPRSPQSADRNASCRLSVIRNEQGIGNSLLLGRAILS
jgi:hypothetical protein